MVASSHLIGRWTQRGVSVAAASGPAEMLVQLVW